MQCLYNVFIFHQFWLKLEKLLGQTDEISLVSSENWAKKSLGSHCNIVDKQYCINSVFGSPLASISVGTL